MNKGLAIFLAIIIIGLAGCTQTQQSTPIQENQEFRLSELSSENLPAAQQMRLNDLTDVRELEGKPFELTAEVVEKELFGKKQVLFAYNRQIPGPVLKVRQGDTLNVTFINRLPYESTVHWHGLRHLNKDDGVPEITQKAVQPGESFGYELSFPDAGIYWYHPHVREDIQQEAGLAGLIIVEPAADQQPNQEAETVREEVLILDDLATEMGTLLMLPFGREQPTHALMGRFGNILLANGKPDYQLYATAGETIRLYVANVANARPFNLTFDGALLNVVGGDMSAYEQEYFAQSILIAPAERFIIEIQFEKESEYLIRNVNPITTGLVGKVIVTKGNNTDSNRERTGLRSHKEVTESMQPFEAYVHKQPDLTLELFAQVEPQLMQQMGRSMQGMPCHRMPDGSLMGECDSQENNPEEIEWEDTMGAMNRLATTNQVHWVLRDVNTGLANMYIPLRAKVGDAIKIRLENKAGGMHPMQHPIHLHGQRFFVTSVNGQPVENRVWKDTVLVPTGATIDILVDVTNPGKWLLHCHIPEHMESGMMAMMEVEA